MRINRLNQKSERFETRRKPNKIEMRLFLRAFIVPVVALGLATALSLYFRSVLIHDTNIVLTYVVAVILVAYFTEGFTSSVLTSMIAILLFNFFFTAPFYSLKVYNPEYFIIFIFMFVSAVMTSSLTVKAKRESHLATVRAKKSQVQYQLSQRLLRVEGKEDVYRIGGEALSSAMNTKVWLFEWVEGELKGSVYDHGKYVGRDQLASHHRSEILAIVRSPKTSMVPGRFYDDDAVFYAPIIGQRACYGVMGLKQSEDPYQDEHNDLAVAIAGQMALAIERETIRIEKRASDLILESEQFRANLLRAISHDLRTPLTAINGTLSTLLDNYGVISEASQKELLANAQEDSAWLIHTVENILSLTRFENNEVSIKMREEYIEELLEDVLRRMEKRCQYHKIQVLLPEEPLAVQVEARLMEQVFINLLDNAIKYTPEGSKVVIRATKLGQHVRIAFEDNGPGIPNASLEKLFTRFFTLGENSDHGRKGIGLGLEICKAIVEAHQGQIHAYNSRSGGAVFEISLPSGRLK